MNETVKREKKRVVWDVKVVEVVEAVKGKAGCVSARQSHHRCASK